jgi:serine phosphatase RsbU (regulator of sigma subunit)
LQPCFLDKTSGKGLQAAMLSTVAVRAPRAMVDEDIAPAMALERLNNVLLRNENAGFITADAWS